MPTQKLVSASFAAGLVAALAAFIACDDDGAAPVDYSGLLRETTESVILPANDAFAGRADELAAAASSLEQTPSLDAFTKTQTAWRAARSALRALDAIHFGPVADLGILERIDLSPASPPELVALVNGEGPIGAETIAAAGGHAKGFLGLEYFLFGQGFAEPKGNSGPTGTGVTAVRSRALVKYMAAEIASSAHQLAEAWAIGKGGFAAEVENAGTTSKRYPTQRAAVDDFVAGGGYALELIVGVRLAEPLGLKADGKPLPDHDPTRASDSAVADMSATLGSVKALYSGDGLASRIRPKTPALDDRMATQLGDCGAKLGAIPAGFANTVASATGVVTAAYDSCKTLKTTWNTDLTSAVGATLKPADNDGD